MSVACRGQGWSRDRCVLGEGVLAPCKTLSVISERCSLPAAWFQSEPEQERTTPAYERMPAVTLERYHKQQEPSGTELLRCRWARE
jgi:hypothetical protein